MANIAFIGLGIMGGPMAMNLIRNGQSVAVYDISEEAMAAFKELDCRCAESPMAAAEGVSFVITMLPNSEHVRDVLLGSSGACKSLLTNALIIDMSTVNASTSIDLAETVRKLGFRMIDAPVGRSPHNAQDGTLLIMAGGTETDVDEARPLFECMADTIHHIGPQGCGIKLKLCNNYLHMVGIVATAEALVLAEKAGLDRATAVKVLSSTSAGRGVLIGNYPRKVLANDITPDFSLRMGHKDISHALDLGSDVSSPLALGAVAREYYALAQSWGREEQDCTAMLLLLEDIARTGQSSRDASDIKSDF